MKFCYLGLSKGKGGIFLHKSYNPWMVLVNSVIIFQVTVSDNGEPPLTYQTRVFVKVEDDNDNRPQFSKRLYRIRTPATEFMGLDIPVFQVLAWDDDEGENGRLTFDIRNSKGDSTIFIVHEKTGMISATGSLVYGDIHHFVVSVFGLSRLNLVL